MMRWLLTLLGLSLSTATANPLIEPAKLGLLVPAYFYPGANDPHWPALASAAAKVPLTVIMNPASGPGEKRDPAYVAAVAKARAAGATVVGYVHISYGKRPLELVQADISRYRALYDIDGVFLDEMASDASPATMNYQAGLIARIRADSPDWTIIGNPGVMPNSLHLGEHGADLIVSFENTATQWQANEHEDVHWSGGDRIERPQGKAGLAHLVHTAANEAVMYRIVSGAASNGINAVYVTDDTMDNPWDTLPTWWSHLVDHVAAINSGA